MRKFIAACRRFDETRKADVIALFCLILMAPTVLFIGVLLDGGL